MTRLGHKEAHTSSTPFKLWIENGFSRREIAERMLLTEPQLEIISTPKQPIPSTEQMAYPSIRQEDYADYFNQRVTQYGIHALWPQASAVLDFSGVACEALLPTTSETIKLLDDKSRFHEWLKNDPYQAYSSEALGAEEVKELYSKWSSEGRKVCIKPVKGVNGNGYWRLTTTSDSLLDNPEDREIHPDVYLKALKIKEQHSKAERLLLMEWLPGPEVSVDILCWNGKPLIHAARTKLENNTQIIQSEHPVLEHAQGLVGKLALNGIISIQYRLDVESNWKILEINPRPAGGSIHSEDAGFGIISQWTKLIAKTIQPEEVVQKTGEVTLGFKKISYKI